MHDPAQVLTASLDRLLVLADHLELSAASAYAGITAVGERAVVDEPAEVDEPAWFDEQPPMAAMAEPEAPSGRYARQRTMPPAVIERLERIECELNELDGKLLGPRGKRRLAEIRAEERTILEGLGYDSYLEMMLSTTESSF